ncbi:MAG: thioredoxin family protein [Sphingobacteriaceae bacterium]|nr:thioredoxin family protein [Sphingobacteriaceae bacterium]
MNKNHLIVFFSLIVALIVSTAFYAINEDSYQEDEVITLDRYNKIVSNKDTAVLVYCSAHWCAACIKMKPIIEETEAYNPSKLKILRIDSDRDKEVSEEFELNTLPLIMLYKKGSMKWTFTGKLEKSALRAKIDPYLF